MTLLVLCFFLLSFILILPRVSSFTPIPSKILIPNRRLFNPYTVMKIINDNTDNDIDFYIQRSMSSAVNRLNNLPPFVLTAIALTLGTIAGMQLLQLAFFAGFPLLLTIIATLTAITVTSGFTLIITGILSLLIIPILFPLLISINIVSVLSIGVSWFIARLAVQAIMSKSITTSSKMRENIKIEDVIDIEISDEEKLEESMIKEKERQRVLFDDFDERLHQRK